MKHFNLLPIILLFIFSCKKNKDNTNVHEIFFLNEAGASMPIQVHGNVASNKLLLMVHGGPGGSTIRYRDEFVKNSNLEKQMAVVYWDQRIAGASQGNYSTTNIKQYKEDLKKVVQLLKYRYGTDKQIYLLGHSWGGFLTPYFLQDGNNQGLIKGYIHVDGAHNYLMNDSLTSAMLISYGNTEIANDRNIKQWKEIVTYCKSHDVKASPAVGRQLNTFAGVAESLASEILDSSSSSFNNTISNDRSILSENINLIHSAVLKIDEQTYTEPISENLHKINIPILILHGRYDFTCPIGLIDDVKKNIGSADVSEKIFEHAGHSPRNNEPTLYWNTIMNWIKMH
jgi:pimeloyl-ACP methyl ester carboxylesterase